VALVFGQMNETPGARMRVSLTALSIAEFFRDVSGQDVLLFVDNVFRLLQAGSEVSTLLGRMPSAVGYQPSLASEMAAFQERIVQTRAGAVTSIQAGSGRARLRSRRTSHRSLAVRMGLPSPDLWLVRNWLGKEENLAAA
jgi:hypothetical protein